jgi:transcription initiation factor TFIIIB Brf1 subunit/transcription initiation factor TFIIB
MGGGGGRSGDMGAAMPQVRRLSKQEMLLDKLKLNKDQKEEATKILSAAMEKAAPARDRLTKGRVVIANAITGKASEEDLKKLFGEYTNVSATMTGIEAEAFGKLYALLKPNQQSKAPQAFELMAGMFAGGGMPGGGAGRGRGGQGRGEGRQ